MNDENYKQYKATIKRIIKSQVSDSDLDEYISKLSSEEVIGTLPRSLYRYRSFNDYTLSEIANRHIFLSPIEDLDDKIDSKFVYSPFEHDLSIQRHGREGRNQEVNEKVQKVNNLFASHTRVACLTQDYKNMPMWYYYAQNHKGICIKYNTKDFSNDTVLLPVIYPSKKNKEGSFRFWPTEDQMKCGAVFNSIVKDESWKFEKEWRLLKYVDDDKNHYTTWDMSDIYLGCDIEADAIEKIKTTIKSKGYRIKLHQMYLGARGLGYRDVID